MEKKKVMLVDDEEDFLRLTKLNLEETGKYEVLTLSSAKDLISVLHSFKPEIIILDLLMPKIGGIEACQMLNDDPVGQRIPLIILSALYKDVDKLKAYKLGVLDYIVKPVETDVLISKIEKVLSKQ
ncbi:MAG: response regulator [Candidatus Omnitrophica bacterium]|nr:response regulator [Candidatus Omnitrophota bacterium]